MNPLLTVDNLKVHFPIKKGVFSRTAGWVHAFSKSGEAGPVCQSDDGVLSCATSPGGAYICAGTMHDKVYCFQADATRGFIPVMSRMAFGDDLNRFVTPVGSAAFAVPPGIRTG